MSRQFPWLSDPNWNTMLDTGSGTSPSIAGLNNFRDREFINTRGPSIVLAASPTLLYALVPYYPFSGPIAQFSIGGAEAVDVYHTRNDGGYLTDSGWESAVGAPAIKLVKWYNQAGTQNDATQGTSLQALVGYDSRGWYTAPSDKFYDLATQVSLNTVFGVIENAIENKASALFGSTVTRGDMFVYGANYYSFSFGEQYSSNVGHYWRDEEVAKGPGSIIDDGSPPADWAGKHVICGQLSTSNMDANKIFLGSSVASPLINSAHLTCRALLGYGTALDEVTVRAPIQTALYDFYQVGV